MRIDYYHIGDSESRTFTIDRIYKQGIWAGSRVNLLDKFNNGAYYYNIYDEASGELIYSKGFDSFFKEYQTSEDAKMELTDPIMNLPIFPIPKIHKTFNFKKR